MRRLTALLIIALLGVSVTVSHAQMSKTDGTLATSNTDYERGRGGTPTVSGCGTGPSVTGTDGAGVIVAPADAGATCVLNFSVAYGSAPICLLASVGSNTTLRIASTTGSALTIQATALANQTTNYRCFLP